MSNKYVYIARLVQTKVGHLNYRYTKFFISQDEDGLDVITNVRKRDTLAIDSEVALDRYEEVVGNLFVNPCLINNIKVWQYKGVAVAHLLCYEDTINKAEEMLKAKLNKFNDKYYSKESKALRKKYNTEMKFPITWHDWDDSPTMDYVIWLENKILSNE